MVEKLTFNSLATALVDIHCTLPQNLTSVTLCRVTKLHNHSTKCTCVMAMLFHQLVDMPHLSGIILAKEKCSLTGV
jgi:hypothetical protein